MLANLFAFAAAAVYYAGYETRFAFGAWAPPDLPPIAVQHLGGAFASLAGAVLGVVLDAMWGVVMPAAAAWTVCAAATTALHRQGVMGEAAAAREAEAAARAVEAAAWRAATAAAAAETATAAAAAAATATATAATTTTEQASEQASDQALQQAFAGDRADDTQD